MNKKLFTLFITTIFSCLACNTLPINPENNQPLVEGAEELSHEEKISLQNEMIKRQEEQKLRQEREYLHLKRQEHYNNLQRRFEDK